MKKLSIISTFIILISLLACEPPVTFTEPQPTETDNISKFPNRLQGQYLSLADSSVLDISDKLIQRIYNFNIKMHINELDSNYSISGDTVFNLKEHDNKIVNRQGDTLIERIHYIDTLFQLDYDNVLRKFIGYYFLNTRYDKLSWVVKKVQLLKGQLVISSISTKLDINNLKEITETIQDTVPPFKFTTTKKQFKKFIKNNGFSDNETFVRIKKSN